MRARKRGGGCREKRLKWERQRDMRSREGRKVELNEIRSTP